MDFKDLMREFGGKVGLDDLQPDGENTCRVDIDGMGVSFMGHVESGTIVTWAEVGEPPPEGVDMLYRVLMEAMFMGQGTGGSAFSIEPQTGNIYLHRVDPLLIMDIDSFCAMLEKFVNVLEQWRKMVADFRPVAAEISRAQEEQKGAESEQMSGGFMQV